MTLETPHFICFVGLDGTGKTTHARILKSRLENQGIECEYVWFRFRHLSSLSVLALARVMRLSSKTGSDETITASVHNFQDSELISFLYPWLVFFDMFVFSFARIRVPLLMGKTIICDRYILDCLVDLMISTGRFDLLENNIGRRFLELIPDNSKLIMLTAKKDDILQRKEEIRFDVGFDVRMGLYKSLASRLEIPVVESDSSIEEVAIRLARILKVV